MGVGTGVVVEMLGLAGIGDFFFAFCSVVGVLTGVFLVGRIVTLGSVDEYDAKISGMWKPAEATIQKSIMIQKIL